MVRDRPVADKYRGMVEELGWKVLGPVNTVLEAMTLLANEEPSVAILGMKFRDGLATPVAEELRRRQVPFILATRVLNPVRQGGSAFAGVRTLGQFPIVRTIARELTRLTEGGPQKN